MAPKSKEHHRKTSEKPRTLSPVPKRKKTSEATTSLPPNVPISVPCASKLVTTGRCVRFDVLEREGFELGENLIALGFQKLCSLEVPTYPNLVREFYGTAARTPAGFEGKVRGVSILVSKDLLGSLLGISTSGLEPYSIDRRELALNTILDREDCDPYMVISSHDLDAESRLLLSIIGRIIFPKSGRFENISERDLAIMYHILNTISFDMASMMLNHIGASTGQNRFSLPYGMVFTLIFRHYNVPIPPSESTIKLRHTDYYSESSLHRMGFIKKDGSWVKKTTTPTQTFTNDPTAEIPENPEQPEPTAPPQAAPHSTSITAADLALISTTILNALTPRLDQLEKQNKELQLQNLELRNDYLAQIQDLKNHNLELQIQLASSQATSSSHTSSAPLPQDTIKEIASAVFAEVRSKFDHILGSIQKLSEEIEGLDTTMSQLKKKINKEAELLLKYVWDISLEVQNEHKDYGIEGISKELGKLKSKIDDAVQAIALLTNDLKTTSSSEMAALLAQLSMLTKEISKRFMLRC